MRWCLSRLFCLHGDFCKTVKWSYDTSVNYSVRNGMNGNSSGHGVLDFEKSAILISDSHDIYRNLALEDWIYKNVDCASKGACFLLMWYNHPAVVIGRHQNPWVECSLDVAKANGISLARRNSGGGTVYHDVGNLNCCFFTTRNKYNRKDNLNLICAALKRKWQLNLALSEREDIIIDSHYKISGTASKLGRNTAYHHCTILVNVDQIMLHQVLHRELHGLESKATSSVKSKVKNLKSVCPEITVPKVIEEIKDQYKTIYKVSEQQVFNIHPVEETFPGLLKIEDELKSWNWIFGRTPCFHVKRTFPLCPSFSRWNQKNLPPSIDVTVMITKGSVESITITPNVLQPKALAVLQDCINEELFSFSILDSCLDKWLMFVSEDGILCKYIKICILQIVQDVYR